MPEPYASQDRPKLYEHILTLRLTFRDFRPLLEISTPLILKNDCSLEQWQRWKEVAKKDNFKKVFHLIISRLYFHLPS